MTEREWETIQTRFDRLEGKVDKLFQFKWQIVGGSIALSGGFSIATTLLIIYVTSK